MEDADDSTDTSVRELYLWGDDQRALPADP
jgi:hypothetical protein